MRCPFVGGVGPDATSGLEMIFTWWVLDVGDSLVRRRLVLSEVRRSQVPRSRRLKPTIAAPSTATVATATPPRCQRWNPDARGSVPSA